MKHAAALSIFLASALSGAPLKVLIIDGQNNHPWQSTTPILKQTLESTGLFQVDVATSPPAGGDMEAFRPKFSEYKVVLSNYNGDAWSADTKSGGGSNWLKGLYLAKSLIRIRFRIYWRNAC